MAATNDFFTLLNHISGGLPKPTQTTTQAQTTQTPVAQTPAARASQAPATEEFAPIDLKSNPDSYEIWVNVPGFEKDAIKVTIQDKILKIAGLKCSIQKSRNLVISRRPHQDSFEHQVKLKTPIDVAKTENCLANGIFYLKLYKSQPDEGVSIPL